MSNNRTYVDQDGNTFQNFGLNGTVTLAGSGFKQPISVATFAVSVIWLACFTALFVALSKIRSGAAPDSKPMKYLRVPVIGVSIFSLLLAFTIDVYNRIIHEKRETKEWWILVITIPQNMLVGLADATLIGFLLWQFTPVLLTFGNVSTRRQAMTIGYYKVLTWFISLANAADKIDSAVLYVLKMLNVLDQVNNEQASKDENKANRFSNLGDSVSNAVFNGLYLLCILAFAIVARIALKGLRETHPLVDHSRFRWSLAILTLSILIRSTLDLAWSLIFQTGSWINPKIAVNNSLTLIDNTLWGFFSVVIYAAILRIATLPDAESFSIADTMQAQQNKQQNTEEGGRLEKQRQVQEQETESPYPSPPIQSSYVTGHEWTREYPYPNSPTPPSQNQYDQEFLRLYEHIRARTPQHQGYGYQYPAPANGGAV